MVPIAHANDGGGSTRIPAACCGLVGLKPQRGRVSRAPEIGESFLAHDGVLTRTVAETAALLDVLAGTELGDAAGRRRRPSRSPSPRRASPAACASPSPSPVARRPGRPGARTGRARRGPLLESLGHEVDEADPPWRRAAAGELFTALFGPAVCSQIAAARMLAGREPAEDDMEPLSWALWQLVGRMSATRRAPRVGAARDLRPRGR